MARPRQISDEAILSAARQCFLDHGPSVSTTVIAQELGLSQATLFKRFGSKQQLMVHAMAPAEEPAWIVQLESGPDDRPVSEQLVEIGLAASNYFRVQVPCLMVLRASGVDPVDLLKRFEKPPPLRARRALTEWFASLVAQGRIRTIDPEIAALTFLGGIHTRFFMAHVLGRVLDDDHAHVTGLVALLCAGMNP